MVKPKKGKAKTSGVPVRPGPQSTGNEEQQLIEKILSSKVVNGKRLYFVKWAGQTPKCNTWEPEDALGNCPPELLSEFQDRFPTSTRNIPITKGSEDSPAPPPAVQCGSNSGKETVGEGGQGQLAKVKRRVTHFQNMDEITMGPLFRRYWRPTEIPICILGSAIHNGCLLHLVRIQKNDDNAEAVLKNPFEGVSDDNVVMVLGVVLNRVFPQLVIKYYECNLELLNNAGTAKEISEKAQKALATSTGKHRQERTESSVGKENRLDKFGLPENDNEDSDDDGDSFEEIL